MATTPQIALRDGSGFTTNLVFTTNEPQIVLTGTVTVDTVAIQISINGGPFVTDSTLVSFVFQGFTVPNPASFPSGLALDIGVNTIGLRAVDIVGGVSAPATAQITRVRRVTETSTDIPTGIRVQRNRNTVNILVAKPQEETNLVPLVVNPPSGPNITPQQTELVTIDRPTLIGFNFYASTSPSGATGYFKVNESPIVDTVLYEEDQLGELDDFAIWDNTLHELVRIRITEEDEFGNELAVRLDSFHDTNALTGRLRYKSTLENFIFNEYVSFTHDRNGGPGLINSDQFANVADNDPLYYVVTGVYFDVRLNTEIETPYSQEVLGTPLIIDTTIRDLPGRNHAQIVQDYVTAVGRVNSEISLIPGSSTRDVNIDPFASEAERIWFLLDFVHRSQSFLTLLALDNVSGDGISDLVVSSAYKQALKAALGLTNDTAVQALIDQQFDKLSANVNKTRLAGRQSVGQVVIYTTAQPTQDIVVPAGTTVISTPDAETGVSSQRFRIGGSYVLPASNALAFFNFNTQRFEIVADVVAEEVGSAGNVPAGVITTITGVSGVSVTNTEATVFGDDQESNANLAARAILGFASVDTGTEGGYASTAAEQIGIIKAKIVKSGDPLMMRDYDDVRRKHIGGKVDIWTQGLRERQVTDNFAFTFDVARDVACQIISITPTQLVLKVLDSRVTVDTPLIEILNNPSQGLGVRNITLGEDYDLTGVVISDYQTFIIDNSIAQPATAIDDIIHADYRFQVVNEFRFTLQPVRRVISVVGEVAGALDPSVHYELSKVDDPLLTGESTIAKDFLAIVPADGKPSGNTITINDEAHVMIGFEPEPLGSVGVNTATIRVFNEDRSEEFDPPSAAVPDYEIIEGTPTTPVRIVRTSGSAILNGQQVSVDYIHDENFAVTYVINDLLQELQQVVNNQRHVTADVLVKQAIQNDVDIETTVQLSEGATKDNADPEIRSNVSLELNRKVIGQGVAQSNVDAAINDSEGVEFNVLPMALMAYADGSRKLREGVLSTYVDPRPTSLDIGGNLAYILTNPLMNPTTDGGGLDVEHRGVFQDDEAFTLSASLATVAQVDRQAYIIGADGAVILGYSDDATLTLEGFSPSEIPAERLRRTANHVVLSLSGSGAPADTPLNHSYAVSYIVRGASGSNDIRTQDVEFINLGDFTITFSEAD